MWKGAFFLANAIYLIVAQTEYLHYDFSLFDPATEIVPELMGNGGDMVPGKRGVKIQIHQAIPFVMS